MELSIPSVALTNCVAVNPEMRAVISLKSRYSETFSVRNFVSPKCKISISGGSLVRKLFQVHQSEKLLSQSENKKQVDSPKFVKKDFDSPNSKKAGHQSESEMHFVSPKKKTTHASATGPPRHMMFQEQRDCGLPYGRHFHTGYGILSL